MKEKNSIIPIEYDGELDSSGNGLENETLYFFDTIRDVMFPFNQSNLNDL